MTRPCKAPGVATDAAVIAALDGTLIKSIPPSGTFDRRPPTQGRPSPNPLGWGVAASPTRATLELDLDPYALSPWLRSEPGGADGLPR
jgi:hypothetical protein